MRRRSKPARPSTTTIARLVTATIWCSSGQIFDLRKLRKDERPRFENSVTNGKNQMPPWKGVLDGDQIDAIWAFIRANANDR